MRVAVVGHGPSLKGTKKGHLIDSHDYVVRMKLGQKLCKENPEDYGSKSDFLVASTEVYGCFVGAKETCWGYPKYGWYKEDGAEQLGVMVPLNLCNFWNWTFRKMGGRHPNFSTGMAAIVISAYELRPKVISLAGFDTLLDPTKTFERITEVPRTGIGDFPDHDWETENQLLGKIEEAYNLKIQPID